MEKNVLLLTRSVFSRVDNKDYLGFPFNSSPTFISVCIIAYLLNMLHTYDFEMQDRLDAGQVGCRTGGIQERWNSGL